MDWRSDQRLSELWSIVEMAGDVEEIPIARLKDMCDEHGISCERFIEVWRTLCDEGYIIINQAEEKMSHVH
jgi:hypothetical protein